MTAADRPDQPRVTIVIPSLNEAANLPRVLAELPPVHQVVLVDGRSADDSIAVARAARPQIEVVHQTRRGKGNALVCGFAAATGDVVVAFDADGSSDPSEIAGFLQALTDGADYAKGSRFLGEAYSDDITVVRTAGNRVLTWISNRLFGTRFTDLCHGYNAFWLDIVEGLGLADHRPAGRPGEGLRWGDGFEIEALLNCRVAGLGLAITEVPTVERPRLHGQSNLHTWSDGRRVLRAILTERWRTHRVRRSHHGGRVSEDGQAADGQAADGQAADGQASAVADVSGADAPVGSRPELAEP